MSGPDAGDSDEDASDDPSPDRGDPRDASSDDAGTPAETRQDESSTRHDAPTDDASRVDGDPAARGEGTRADAEFGSRNPRTSDSRSGRASAGDAVTIEDDGVVRWFLKTENETVVLVRDIASSVAIVAVIGLVLFGVSGVWPPLVAVESGSMEPNMERGDLVFVVDDDRFVGDDPVDGTGVVTAENGVESGHEKFGNPGDVVVFRPDGSEYETPVIHRAEFWVDEGENWVDTKADEAVIGGATCDQIETCPADHAGFITKGDNNAGYDQQDRYRGAQTDVVKPEWVTGKASFRIPWLGHVRLTFDRLLGATVAPSPAIELADSLPAETEALAMGAQTGPPFAAVATGLAGSGAVLRRYRR